MRCKERRDLSMEGEMVSNVRHGQKTRGNTKACRKNTKEKQRGSAVLFCQSFLGGRDVPDEFKVGWADGGRGGGTRDVVDAQVHVVLSCWRGQRTSVHHGNPQGFQTALLVEKGRAAEDEPVDEFLARGGGECEILQR